MEFFCKNGKRPSLIWLCRVPSIEPPTALQSSSELELTVVYPVVGGVSGNSSRNAPRATLNPSSDRWRNVVFGDFHFLTIGEKYDPGKKMMNLL